MARVRPALAAALCLAAATGAAAATALLAPPPVGDWLPAADSAAAPLSFRASDSGWIVQEEGAGAPGGEAPGIALWRVDGDEIVGWVFRGPAPPLRFRGSALDAHTIEVASAPDDGGTVHRLRWTRRSDCELSIRREVSPDGGQSFGPAGETDYRLDLPGCAPEAAAARVAKGAEAEVPASAAPAPTATAPAPAPPTAAPPAPAEGAPAPVAPAPVAPAPRAEAVLVAGEGKPFDAVEEGVADVIDFLAGRGVEVLQPGDERLLVHSSEASLPYLLERVRDEGLQALLHLEMRFGHREHVLATCYDPRGQVLWRERVRGGLGLRDATKNPRLIERMTEKLERRLGGPGLTPAGD